MAEANLRDQSLKSQAALGGRARTPRSSSMTTICSIIPPNCAARSISAYCSLVELLMTLNLLERGLADIYNRQAFLMSPDNLLANRPDPVSRQTGVRHA